MLKNISFFLAMAFITTSANATLITSSGDVALTGATTITFSEQAFSTSPSFTFGDVTFDALGSNSLRLQNNPCSSVCVPNTGPILSNQTSGTSGTGFTVDFASSVSAFGFGAAAMNSALSVSAFDSLNNLIETFNFSGSCCGFQFGGISAAGISSLLVSTSDLIAFDNFMYVSENTAVPEPTVLALFVIGLAGIGASRKKRKV